MKKDKEPVVFFDFDNTITTYDVLDDMLMRFSLNDRWKELEERWRDGKIGSKRCLKGQVEGIRIRKRELDRYLAKVRIDPYFKILLRHLESRKIKAVILSDNFDYILKRILKHNGVGVGTLRIYSNGLKMRGDRLIPRFRSLYNGCGNCAHCKKDTLLSNRAEGSPSVYIGDGRSDICASRRADTVFAKDYLLKYYRAKELAHIPFKTFKDIYHHFKKEAS